MVGHSDFTFEGSLGGSPPVLVKLRANAFTRQGRTARPPKTTLVCGSRSPRRAGARTDDWDWFRGARTERDAPDTVRLQRSPAMLSVGGFRVRKPPRMSTTVQRVRAQPSQEEAHFRSSIHDAATVQKQKMRMSAMKMDRRRERSSIYDFIEWKRNRDAAIFEDIFELMDRDHSHSIDKNEIDGLITSVLPDLRTDHVGEYPGQHESKFWHLFGEYADVVNVTTRAVLTEAAQAAGHQEHHVHEESSALTLGAFLKMSMHLTEHARDEELEELLSKRFLTRYGLETPDKGVRCHTEWKADQIRQRRLEEKEEKDRVAALLQKYPRWLRGCFETEVVSSTQERIAQRKDYYTQKLPLILMQMIDEG